MSNSKKLSPKIEIIAETFSRKTRRNNTTLTYEPVLEFKRLEAKKKKNMATF